MPVTAILHAGRRLKAQARTGEAPALPAGLIGAHAPSSPAFRRAAGTRLPARRSRLWAAIEGEAMNDGPILTGAVIVSAAVSALLVHFLLLG